MMLENERDGVFLCDILFCVSFWKSENELLC